MKVKEIHAKTLLRKHKKIDSWFITRYGLNPYRGCLHNCSYCDGRDPRYNVEGDFGNEICVKINAIQLLDRELSPKGKRKPMKKAFIFPGGGVGDLYQAVEKKYMLAKKILQTIYKYNFPLHILTKSTLAERDMELIKAINNKSRALVSSSFSSVDDDLSKIFEPGVPPPSKRLDMLSRFKQEGIAVGMYLLPVIPYITDGYDHIDLAVKRAEQIGADFVLFGGMTLKPGPQKDYFMNVVKDKFPLLYKDIESAYNKNGKYGEANLNYYSKIGHVFNKVAKKYMIPTRIPKKFFEDILDINDLTVVLFEHIHHYKKQKGEESNFSYVAYQISQIDKPLSEMGAELKNIPGIKSIHTKAIHEITDTGTCSIYEELVP